MNNKKILTIIRGEEFKLSLKEKIETTDIFYDQYLEAANMLDDIVAINDDEKRADWSRVETENNIIAFCGDRGEGKSSVMMTFINALSNKDAWNQDPIFSSCEHVKRTAFSRPVFIDPSTFDHVHNILEVVVARLYREYRVRYENDPGAFENEKCGKLLEKFQKVYRIISLLNNPEKMLEEEFDGESNIANLAKMGESTALKGELETLIQLYLDYMMRESDCRNRKLLIAIDDLDLCNANAYKMAEQIRKYLILPEVVIVMALKVEQLQMCVQEENFKNYRNVLTGGEKPSEFYEEVRNMAEKYIAKLIPRSRRIYLPNVRYIHNSGICYMERTGEIIYKDEFSNSLNASLLNMIYIKTGMKFLLNPNSVSWLQAKNLRDAVNMITLLGNMPEPKNDEECYNNIETFSRYIEKEWIPQNFSMTETRELQDLIKMPYSQMNSEVVYLLQEKYDSTKKKHESSKQNYNMGSLNNFFWIRKWLDDYKRNVYDREAEKFAYVFHVWYTICFNEALRQKRYGDLSFFLGGYIWGKDFDQMFPNAVYGNIQLNRSRFELQTSVIYNLITERIEKIFEIRNERLEENGGRVSKIPEDDPQKEYKMFTWMLLGLFSNTFQTGNRPVLLPPTLTRDSIVYTNYILIGKVQICMENYIVGLCNLGEMYTKINMEMLGINWNEYIEFITRIENNNQEKISAFRRIFTNIDLISAFYDYCYYQRDVKEGGKKDAHGRTEAVVDRFFRNVEHFWMDYLSEHIEGKINELVIENSQGIKRTINISEIYADLFEEYETEYMEKNDGNQGIVTMPQEERYRKMMEQLNEDLLSTISPLEAVRPVSGYLKKRTVDNAKTNLGRLVHNIRRYYGKRPDKDIRSLDTERLENYYGIILKSWLVNPILEVSDDLNEEYKRIVKYYNDLIKE